MSFAKDYQEQRTAVGTVLFHNGRTNDRDLEFADYVVRGTKLTKSRGGRNLEEVLEGLKDGSLILYEGERMGGLVMKFESVLLRMVPRQYYDVTVTIRGQTARIQGQSSWEWMEGTPSPSS